MFVFVWQQNCWEKKFVWELVNRSDFLHSNHTLNLFPLSDQVFLALCFFRLLSIFLCFDAKSKYCSKVVLPMQKNRVWLKSIYRYHSHNLTQPKRIDAFILWRLPQNDRTILANDFNADTNFHNDDNWTNPFIYVPVKKKKSEKKINTTENFVGWVKWKKSLERISIVRS